MPPDAYFPDKVTIVPPEAPTEEQPVAPKTPSPATSAQESTTTQPSQPSPAAEPTQQVQATEVPTEPKTEGAKE
jgi:hypothetical protein